MPRLASPAKPWRGGDALRNARTCYDHLAGRLGVALAERLARDGHVRFEADGTTLTGNGARFLAARGIAPARGKRPYCRACLDWSERRPHLAGTLGAALAAHAFTYGWVRRIPGGRALEVTETGWQGFAREFGVSRPGWSTPP